MVSGGCWAKSQRKKLLDRNNSMIWECVLPPLGLLWWKISVWRGKTKQMGSLSPPAPWWWQCRAEGSADCCRRTLCHCWPASCLHESWKAKFAAAQQLSSEDLKAFNKSGHCKYCPTLLLGGNANPESVTIACSRSVWNKNLKSQFLYHCCVSGNLLHALRARFYQSIMVMEWMLNGKKIISICRQSCHSDLYMRIWLQKCLKRKP